MNGAQDNVGTCVNLAATLCEELTLFNSSDLSEIQQTCNIARSTLAEFMGQRPVDPSFDFLVGKLKGSLLECSNILQEFKREKLAFSKWPMEKKLLLFQKDYLVKQQVDQLHFEFIQNKDMAPPSGLSDPFAKKFWIEKFGADVKFQH